MTFKIDVSGLVELQATLGRLTGEQMGHILEPMVRGGLAIFQEYIAKYPGGPRYPLRWKSDRQRKFVMAKLKREGNLPYRRRASGGLGGGWTSKTTRRFDGVQGVLGNNAPHAIFVQGERQQPFHTDTGWRTVEQTFIIRGPEVERLFQEGMDRAIRRLTGG